MDELWKKCAVEKSVYYSTIHGAEISISKLQTGCVFPGSGFRCFWNNISKTLFNVISEVAKIIKYKPEELSFKVPRSSLS